MAMLMITSGTALLLASSMSIIYSFFQVRKDAVVDLGSSARLVLANTRVSVSFDDATDARQVLDALGSNPSIRLACLYRPEGAFFAEFRPYDGATCPAKAPPAGSSYSGGRLELIERDAVVQGQAGAWVLIQSDLTLLSERLRSQATITLVVFAVALVLAFVLSSVLQRIVSQPVVELAQLTQAVSATGDIPGASRSARKTNSACWPIRSTACSSGSRSRKRNGTWPSSASARRTGRKTSFWRRSRTSFEHRSAPSWAGRS